MRLNRAEKEVLGQLLARLWSKGQKSLKEWDVEIDFEENKDALESLLNKKLLEKKSYEGTLVYQVLPEALLRSPEGKQILQLMSRLLRELVKRVRRGRQGKVKFSTIHKALSDVRLERLRIASRLLFHSNLMNLELGYLDVRHKRDRQAEEIIAYVLRTAALKVSRGRDANDLIRLSEKRYQAALKSREELPPIGGPEVAALFEDEIADEEPTEPGVSLRQVARILADGDREEEDNLLNEWRRSRAKKPESIGFDPRHSQQKLYKPAAVVSYLNEISTDMSIPEHALLQRLKEIARKPRPATD